MERFKNYVIICLFIFALVEGFIIFCGEPKVTKSVTYITTKGKITGATNATISNNGNITASGSNLTIDTNTQNYTQTTFNYNGIYAGISCFTDLGSISASGEVSYVNRDIVATIGYNPFKKEITAGFKKSIFTW